jgi:hypothetical protein
MNLCVCPARKMDPKASTKLLDGPQKSVPSNNRKDSADVKNVNAKERSKNKS